MFKLLRKNNECFLAMADASINVDEEPLMFQTKCGGEEENEEEKGQRCKCIRAGLSRCKSCGIWRVVAWVYTQLCQWSDFGGSYPATLLSVCLHATLLPSSGHRPFLQRL